MYIKRLLFIAPVVVTALLSTGCNSKNASSNSAQNETVVLTGDYKSMQGVMNPVSCYCGNGGYLTTESGEKTAICFGDKDKPDCKTITVTGHYTTVTVAADPNNPCPAGQMRLLEVTSFTCK